MAETVVRQSGPASDASLASTDGDTIVGDGTSRDPLRIGPGGAGAGGTFAAAFRGGLLSPAPGMPVFASFVAQAGGITTVQPTSVSPSPPSLADFDAFAGVCGLVESVNEDGTVQVRPGGLLTLAAAQWDAMTGGSGGLVAGSPYYAALSSDSDDFLTTSPDPTPGTFTTRVGVAVGNQAMIVAPGPPAQNLGDLIVFAAFGGQPLIVGSAVVVSSDDHVVAAQSDVSVAAAQAIGVVAAFDGNGDPIVQIGGTVTLSAAEWDAVTDSSPGMVPGAAYYVDTSARPGHLTIGAPTTDSKVQVGVGLSGTQMAIAPYLQRLS